MAIVTRTVTDGGEVVWQSADVHIFFREITAEALAAAAHEVATEAKINIVSNDQVDTGFMLNSVYVVDRSGSDYLEARALAEAKRSGSGSRYIMAPEVRAASSFSGANEYRTIVAVGARYAIYQEAAKPFLYPALVTVSGRFNAKLIEIARPS